MYCPGIMWGTTSSRWAPILAKDTLHEDEQPPSLSPPVLLCSAPGRQGASILPQIVGREQDSPNSFCSHPKSSEHKVIALQHRVCLSPRAAGLIPLSGLQRLPPLVWPQRPSGMSSLAVFLRMSCLSSHERTHHCPLVGAACYSESPEVIHCLLHLYFHVYTTPHHCSPTLFLSHTTWGRFPSTWKSPQGFNLSIIQSPDKWVSINKPAERDAFPKHIVWNYTRIQGSCYPGK